MGGRAYPLFLVSAVFICGCETLQKNTDDLKSPQSVEKKSADGSKPSPSQAWIFNTLQEERISNLKPPGFFDIGAGYAFLANTNDSGADGSGFMLTLKGYPLGRWYSTKPDLRLSLPKNATKSLLDPNEDQIEVLRRPDKYVVMDANGRVNWLKRLSAYYGISLEKFQGGGTDCTVHSIGLGIDVTPELAFTFGMGFYDPGNHHGDIGTTFLFGVCLNLNAFTSMMETAAGR